MLEDVNEDDREASVEVRCFDCRVPGLVGSGGLMYDGVAWQGVTEMRAASMELVAAGEHRRGGGYFRGRVAPRVHGRDPRKIVAWPVIPWLDGKGVGDGVREDDTDEVGEGVAGGENTPRVRLRIDVLEPNLR